METIKQVTLLLEKVQKDWGRVHGSDKVTRIDKDILVEDIRLLYELVHELEIGSVISSDEERKFQADHIAEPEKDEPVKEATPEPLQPNQTTGLKKDTTSSSSENIEAQHEEKKTQDANEIEPKIVAKAEPVFTPEPDTDNVEEEDSRETTSEPQEPDLSAKIAKPSAAEKFAAVKTLADIYRANGDNSIAAKMQKNKIADLKTAIGINEKFLFINEIFKGETAAYNKAIDDLNNINHYHEALEYLEQIRREIDVNNDEAWSAMVNILKRKF